MHQYYVFVEESEPRTPNNPTKSQSMSEQSRENPKKSNKNLKFQKIASKKERYTLLPSGVIEACQTGKILFHLKPYH
jgi:hypothetical protein